MNTLDQLFRGASWPLRRLGLESGRAQANAQPSPAELRATRAELLAYIRAAHRRPSTVDGSSEAG